MSKISPYTPKQSRIPVRIQRNKKPNCNKSISIIIPTIHNSSDPDFDDLQNGKITEDDYMNRSVKWRCSSPILESFLHQSIDNDLVYLKFEQHLIKPITERMRIMFEQNN